MQTRICWLCALVWPVSAVAEPPALTAQEVAPKISWRDAGDYLDRDCTVYGKVVLAKKIRGWCFLNFHEDYRSTFTAAIPERIFDKFPQSPELMYDGQEVAVFGRVVEYKGKPEIIVSGPEDIVIGATLPEPAEGAAPEKPARPATPTKPAEFTGTVSVATFNLLNLFDDDDDPYHNDQGTPPKPREQMQRLAETFRKLDADVVALQEVENRGYLKRFVDMLIPGLGYEHLVLFEGNDRRGIDVAVLSRFPIGPVTSYRHLRFPDGNGKMMSFRRDLLQATIEPPGGVAFDVFAVHLKSKRSDDQGKSLAIRLGEARQIRKILDAQLARDPQARFVICGDFNDTFDSKPLQTIIGQGSGALTALVDDLPEEQRVTYNKEPYRSMIDFVLTSPSMAKRYRPGSARVIPGSISSGGSDHNPVAVVFNME
ncbi:MAG: hypothetical protein GY778_29255 [bacterium]|nr:hypothetical protein [bacterium]